MKATTFPFFSQFSEEQMKNQYRANLVGLKKMLAKAEQTDKKVNGYTIDQLRVIVIKYTELAK
jgi:hypothetical protein